MCELPGRLGVSGIKFRHAPIGLGGLVEAAKVKQRKALVEQHVDEVRPQCQRLVEPPQAFVISVEPEQRIAHVVAGERIGRIERMRADVVGKTVLITPQRPQHARPHLQCRGVVRSQPVANVGLQKRLVEALELMQNNGALIGRFPMVRVELQGVLKAQKRIAGPADRRERDAELFPEFGIVRLELHGFVEHAQRLVEPAHLLQRDPERRQIVRSGILQDRARQPLDRMVILLRL